MIGVTADSNIYVSALNFPGPPARLLAMANVGAMSLLHRKFDWPGELMNGWRWKIRGFTNRVAPTEKLDVIKHDLPDNRVLECSAAANSDYIVTADKDLLRLGSFGNASILRAPDFLNVLLEKLGHRR